MYHKAITCDNFLNKGAGWENSRVRAGIIELIACVGMYHRINITETTRSKPE